MSGETTHSSAVSSIVDNLLSPVVLFFLLNLMIASIAISSRLSRRTSDNGDHQAGEHGDGYHISQQQQHGHGEEEEVVEQASSFSSPDPPSQPVSRSPSLLGSSRFFSVDVGSMRHQGHQEFGQAETTEQHFGLGPIQEDVYKNIMENDARVKARDREAWSRNMRRSLSIRSSNSGRYHQGESSERREDLVEKRRPSSARGRREDDDEVDVRADDFINRFKQQLKLQRIESLTKNRAKSESN